MDSKMGPRRRIDDQPVSGDITTEDYHSFWEVGGLSREPWLRTPNDWEWEETVEAIRQKTEEEQFWPNFWFISDHGNVSSIGLQIWPPPPPEAPGYVEKESDEDLE